MWESIYCATISYWRRRQWRWWWWCCCFFFCCAPAPPCVSHRCQLAWFTVQNISHSHSHAWRQSAIDYHTIKIKFNEISDFMWKYPTVFLSFMFEINHIRHSKQYAFNCMHFSIHGIICIASLQFPCSLNFQCSNILYTITVDTIWYRHFHLICFVCYLALQSLWEWKIYGVAKKGLVCGDKTGTVIRSAGVNVENV